MKINSDEILREYYEAFHEANPDGIPLKITYMKGWFHMDMTGSGRLFNKYRAAQIKEMTSRLLYRAKTASEKK